MCVQPQRIASNTRTKSDKTVFPANNKQAEESTKLQVHATAAIKDFHHIWLVPKK